KCGSSPSPFRMRRVLRRLRARDFGDHHDPQGGTRVETNRPTTAIVENGPYRFRRNPISCMFLGRAGLAMGFNSAWIFATLAPFSLQNLFGCNLWDTDTHAEQPGRPAQDLSRSSRAR